METLVFLKQVLSLFLFIYFMVFHFYVRKLSYSLQKYVIDLKKKFFCHLHFMKNGVLSCLKMSLYVFVTYADVSDYDRREVFCMRGGQLYEIL